MKKRIMSIILICSMLMGIVVGCGSGEESKKQGSSYNGEKVTLTVGLPMSANVTDFDDNAFTKYIEESLNMELEFVSFTTDASESAQQLALMVSAEEELPDVLWGFYGLSHYTAREFGEDGYFIDLTDLLDEWAPNYKEQYDKLSKEEKKRVDEKGVNPSNGAIYGMPMVGTPVIDSMQNAMFINQTWLDKLGLKAPTTIEELNVVLEAFATKDPNGNGQADEIPMLSRTGTSYDITAYLINAFLYYDTNNAFNVTNGKVWDPSSSDEYRQALIYANELCKKGYLSDLCFTLTAASEYISLITPSDNVAKVGIWCGNPVSMTNSQTEILDQYVAFDSLEDATGKGGYTVVREKDINFCSFITKDCEYPEAAMRFLDFFYEDETVTRMRHGEKGVDWEEAEGFNVQGEPATIKVLNPTAFFKGNSTWCRNGNAIMTADNYIAIAEEGTGRQAECDRLTRESWKFMTSDRVPQEVVGALVYTSEEYEIRSEYAGLYTDQVQKSRNRFITGDMDPSDDGDWKEYTSSLKNLGQADLLKVAQQAYNRKSGK